MKTHILTFMIFVEWSKICDYFKTVNGFYVLESNFFKSEF